MLASASRWDSGHAIFDHCPDLLAVLANAGPALAEASSDPAKAGVYGSAITVCERAAESGKLGELLRSLSVIMTALG